MVHLDSVVVNYSNAKIIDQKMGVFQPYESFAKTPFYLHKIQRFFDNIETIVNDIKYYQNDPNIQLEIQGLTI